MNYSISEKKVKTFQEKLNIFFKWLYTFFHVPEMNIQPTSGICEYIYKPVPTTREILPDCALGFDKGVLINPPIELKNDRPKRMLYEKYPYLYLEGIKGIITNKTLIKTYNQRMKNRPIIAGIDHSGNYFQYYAKIKGDRAYNESLKQKIIDQSEKIALNNQYLFFLTLTYDVKTHGSDLIIGWKKFKHHVDLTLKSLRKKMKFEYIVVLESTLKGRPHAHILIGTNEKKIKVDDKIKAGAKLRKGYLYRTLVNQVHSPIFVLQKAINTKIKYYLTKYIVKTTLKVEKSLFLEKMTLSPNLRKDLLSLLMPIVSGVRQIRFSKIKEGSSKPEKKEKVFSIEKSVACTISHSENKVITEISHSENKECSQCEGKCENKLFLNDDFIYRANHDIQVGEMWLTTPSDLINILNKLPCTKKFKAFLITNKVINTALKPYNGWNNKEKYPLYDLAVNYGKPLQCSGCWLSKLYHEISQSEQYSPKKYTDMAENPELIQALENLNSKEFRNYMRFSLDKNCYLPYNEYKSNKRNLVIEEILNLHPFLRESLKQEVKIYEDIIQDYPTHGVTCYSSLQQKEVDWNYWEEANQISFHKWLASLKKQN